MIYRHKIAMLSILEEIMMKSIGKVTILMTLVVLLSFGGVGLLKLFEINGGPVTRIVPSLAMIIGAIVFLKLIDKKHFSDIGLHKFISVLDYTAILIILALVPLFWGLITIKGIQLIKPIDITVIATVAYCFLIGFSEELLYRGYIYNAISANKLRIVVSAFAFAGFHFISPEFNIILFVLYFFYGVIKVYLFKTIKNLWPLIIFHMIWDLATTYTDFYSNPIIDLLSLAATVAVIGLIVKYRDNRIWIKEI